VRGIVIHKLPDPAWGFPQVARVIPNDDHPWGILRFLVGTDWEPLFPRIPFIVLDQALRGYATPLMKILGPPPKALVKRLPVVDTLCAQHKSCVSYTAKCVPGPKVPECWEPSTFSGDEANLISNVVRTWRDGIVIVVAVPEVAG
jgi:hypothetical protein